MRSARMLAYAELDIATSAHTRARDRRAHAEAMLEARRGDQKTTGEGAESGVKTLARIEQRLQARLTRTQMRNALDLIRQQELLENMERRRARTQQRRWFVIGRAIDALMQEDAAFDAQITALLDRHLIRASERKLLDLASLATRTE
jgi:hypothetical protein